jgi:hypothetical protein
MQIGQQIINLLIRQHISEAIHLVPPHANYIFHAIIVRGHAADGKIFPLEEAF